VSRDDRQITDLVHAALERSGADRAAFLDDACANDPALREAVEALLALEGRVDEFLEGTALRDAPAALFDDEDAQPSAGTRIGSYIVRRQLGHGGMGEVILAEDVRLGRKVALKLLDPAMVDDDAARARFLREARLASSLEHANICTIFEVGEDRDRLFIAMQLVDGETLRQVIAGRPLPLDAFVSIAAQVADALSAAHARGIVHRDVKSANVMVTAEQQVKVLDFGLATLFEHEEQTNSNITVTGAVLGTPASMSPEQARGQAVDHRSDVFSFGVLLYEMATGVMPFTGRTRADVVSAVLNAPHRAVTEINPAIPPALARAIDRALSKERSDRYQTIRALRDDVQRSVAGAAGVDSAQPPRPADGTRRRGMIATVAGLASVAVLLLLLPWATRPRNPASPTDGTLRTVAVLPFKPLIAAQRDEALELGIADTLISRLGVVKDLEVRPITAVRRYTALDQDAVAAGREQRVDAVIEGQIQKAPDRVRVSVRLLRVRDGQQLWAEQFDEPLVDIFSLQDAVSERISSALLARDDGSLAAMRPKRDTRSVDAYELYLLGRYHLNRLTDDGFQRALEYFEAAVEKDPDYAAAHAGIAEAHLALSGFNAVRPEEGFPKARAAAERALQLDDSLALAHMVLASTSFLHDWNWKAAEGEYQRALQLNANASDARMNYGLFLASVGRHEDALRETQRALDLDPLSPVKICGVGDALYLARRFAEAETRYRDALRVDPNLGYTHWALGRTLTDQGRYADAEEVLRRAITLSGDSPDETAELARSFALAGRKDEAAALLESLRQTRDRRYVAPVTLASLYAALDDPDRAFAWLDRAIEERDFLLVTARVEPMFDKLRADDRFAVLLRRMALPP
jgi:serine/threonine-protein kinase